MDNINKYKGIEMNVFFYRKNEIIIPIVEMLQRIGYNQLKNFNKKELKILKERVNIDSLDIKYPKRHASNKFYEMCEIENRILRIML